LDYYLNFPTARKRDGIAKILMGRHGEWEEVAGMDVHGQWIAMSDVGFGAGAFIWYLKVPVLSMERDYD